MPHLLPVETLGILARVGKARAVRFQVEGDRDLPDVLEEYIRCAALPVTEAQWMQLAVVVCERLEMFERERR